MIELFVLNEYNYPINIMAICNKINSLQNRLRVNFINETVILQAKDNLKYKKKELTFDKHISKEISLDNTFAVFNKQSFYDSEKEYVLFIYKELEDDYFEKSRANLCIISTYDWLDLTDIPLELGSAYFISENFYNLILPSHDYHTETRGCPFDFADTKSDIALGIKIGKLCEKCQLDFENDRRVDKKDMLAASLLLKYIAECWHNKKDFSYGNEKNFEKHSKSISYDNKPNKVVIGTMEEIKRMETEKLLQKYKNLMKRHTLLENKIEALATDKIVQVNDKTISDLQKDIQRLVSERYKLEQDIQYTKTQLEQIGMTTN